MRLSQETKAIVTGAASGIGQATAVALAAKGVQLWLTDIEPDGLQRTADQARALGVPVRQSVCDLADFAQLDALIAEIRQHWPDASLLVNSAGISSYGRTHEIDEAAWNKVMAVNLLAPIRLTNALLPALTAQPVAHVINLCSIFGLATMPHIAAYQTSKFGLVGYSRALDAKYGHRNFGVTAVCPGIVRTPMIADLDRAMARSGVKIPSWIGITPEHVARQILHAIDKNYGLAVVAPMAKLLWHVTRLAPNSMRWVNRHRFFVRQFLRRLPPQAS